MSKIWVVLFSLFYACENVYASGNTVVFPAALKSYCKSSDKAVLQNKSVTITKADLENVHSGLNSEAIINLIAENQEPKEIDFRCGLDDLPTVMISLPH